MLGPVVLFELNRIPTPALRADTPAASAEEDTRIDVWSNGEQCSLLMCELTILKEFNTVTGFVILQ